MYKQYVCVDLFFQKLLWRQLVVVALLTDDDDSNRQVQLIIKLFSLFFQIFIAHNVKYK
jgi:hypothetical protein